MKKIIVVLLLVLSLGLFTACNKPAEEEKGMSKEEFLKAKVDDEVVINTYIQGRQSWWDGTATFYTQNDEGGYFIYAMPCTEEEFNTKLTVGAHILVTGTKAIWSGEEEIANATFKILSGTKLYGAVDVTSYFGTDELAGYMNQHVCLNNIEVMPANEAGDAFLYRWNGSGVRGDDLYFNVKVNGVIYSFTVESYLCGAETEVYKAVENLKVGDRINLEGFLYWYEGPQPHVTGVTVIK